MPDEYIDTPWAKEAVKKMNAAIAEWNKTSPIKERISIAWGSPIMGEDEAEMREKVPLDDQCQYALCNYGDVDFEIQICKPTEEIDPVLVRVGLMLKRPIRLRTDPRDIFNAMHALGVNCQPFLVRHGDDKIQIFAIQSFLYASGLSGRVLRHALDRLQGSFEFLCDELISDDGIDPWNGDDDNEEDEE